MINKTSFSILLYINLITKKKKKKAWTSFPLPSILGIKGEQQTTEIIFACRNSVSILPKSPSLQVFFPENEIMTVKKEWIPHQYDNLSTKIKNTQCNCHSDTTLLSQDTFTKF